MKKGDVFWDFDYKYHIVDIVYDGETELLIYKYYGKYKQWWHYEVMEKWKLTSGLMAKVYSLKKLLQRGAKIK